MKLEEVIKEIEFARKIHVGWAKLDQTSKSNKKKIEIGGNKEWHEKWVKIYDYTLKYLNK